MPRHRHTGGPEQVTARSMIAGQPHLEELHERTQSLWRRRPLATAIGATVLTIGMSIGAYLKGGDVIDWVRNIDDSLGCIIVNCDDPSPSTPSFGERLSELQEEPDYPVLENDPARSPGGFPIGGILEKNQS